MEITEGVPSNEYNQQNKKKKPKEKIRGKKGSQHKGCAVLQVRQGDVLFHEKQPPKKNHPLKG